MKKISHEDHKVLADYADDIAQTMKVFGNKHRVRIIAQLCVKSMNVTQLTKAVGMQQTSVSQILDKLKKHGIVNVKERGREAIYSIAETKNMVEFMLLMKGFFDKPKELNNSAKGNFGMRARTY